ncbi:MAG: polysaccharide biosynthesis C-terminal domain-containing protein [Deltaproteobacteria bacterium]
MKREFLINISFLLLINLLIKPVFVFFIDSRAQDVLGTHIYGQYFALFNLAYILSIFTDLGIQNYNSRTIARDKTLLADYLPNILGVKLLLSFIVIIIGVLVILISGYDQKALGIFLLIVSNQILLSFILYLRTNISASGKYRWDSIISVIDKLLLIAFLGMILYSSLRNNFSIYQYIFSQTVAYLIVLVLVIIINFRLVKIIVPQFSIVFFKKIIRSSIPYSMVIIMMTVYMRIDGFLLERMLGNPEQAGIYAAAYRVFDAFNNLGYLFAVLLLPMFASLLAEREKLLNLISTSHDLLLFIASNASVITILYSREIMNFLYPAGYNATYSNVLSLLMLSFFSISMNYIYGTLLTSAGKINSLNKTVFIAVIINLTSNLILIPRYGAEGAAIASIFTQSFVFIIQYFLCIRFLKHEFNIYLFFKRMSYLMIIMAIAYTVRNLMTDYNWFLSVMITAIISVVLAAFAGFLKFSEFKRR